MGSMQSPSGGSSTLASGHSKQAIFCQTELAPVKTYERVVQRCSPCRKRKRKCDGTYPCSACKQFWRTCIYKPQFKPAYHATKACDLCYKSKQKCDETFPCSRCISRTQTCTYERAMRRQQLPGPAQEHDLPRFVQHGCPSSGNNGMGLEPLPEFNYEIDELEGAAAMTSICSLSSLEPHPGAPSADAPETLPQTPLLTNFFLFSGIHNYGIDSVHNILTDVELSDAEEMGKKWVNLSEDATACVNAKPELLLIIARLAKRLIKSQNFHSGTATLNGLWDAIQGKAEPTNSVAGPFLTFRSQQGHNTPITVGDVLSLDCTIFVPSRLRPSFSTYGCETRDGVAHLGPYDPLQWMFGAMLGKKIGDRLLYRMNSGIHSLWYFIEVVKVNGIVSTSSYRAIVLQQQGAVQYSYEQLVSTTMLPESPSLLISQARNIPRYFFQYQQLAGDSQVS